MLVYVYKGAIRYGLSNEGPKLPSKKCSSKAARAYCAISCEKIKKRRASIIELTVGGTLAREAINDSLCLQ